MQTGNSLTEGSTGTAYQWQMLVGGTWTDISGATGATLNIPGDTSYVGESVRVVATTTDSLDGTTSFTGEAYVVA